MTQLELNVQHGIAILECNIMLTMLPETASLHYVEFTQGYGGFNKLLSTSSSRGGLVGL